MKRLLLAVAACACVFGCQSNPKDDLTRRVEIKSIPEGATIILNGMSAGKAPIEVEFESNELGCFVKKTMISALPQDPKLHTQVISFPSYNQNNPELSTIPESIIFNMYKSPSEEGAVEKE